MVIHYDLESGQEVIFALGLKWKDCGPAVQGGKSIYKSPEVKGRWHSWLPEFTGGYRHLVRKEERTVWHRP